MTPKERVRCSLAWHEPDRAPIEAYLTPEVLASLERHFTGRSVLECLGVDFRGVEAPYRGPLRAPEGDVFFDIWGTGYRRVKHGSGGAYDEAVIHSLARPRTVDEVEAHPWPSPDDFDTSQVEAQCDALGDYAIVCGGPGTPDILNGVSRGRGMEQVVIDIATRDPVGLAIIDQRCAITYEVMRRTLAAGRGKIDILHIGEDTANQRGRMFSPKDFDEVFRPRLQRFIDLGHEFGAKVMLHSCGDTHDLHLTFIDMGLDILDSMQPEPPGMDIEAARERCRGKLAFCGLISTQRTLPFGTVEQCRAEARHRLDVVARGGGYIFAPAHNIQPDTPVENILAVYEEATGRKLM